MKIVIAGGGTAGWLAAYIISQSQPGVHDITVVESSSIGIIGTGEGSTGKLIEILNGDFTYRKNTIDIDDFVRKTDATNKNGIRHINWTGDKSSYFAPLDFSPSAFTLNDLIFKYVLANVSKENIHLASEIGIRHFHKIEDRYEALHVDGHKVGQFFKNILSKTVYTIDSVIKDINVNNFGDVESIILDDGKNIDADFFIDCTGFSKIFSGPTKNKWISLKKYLPVNTAIPFILDHDEEIIPETKAVALSSGWMWDIPLQTRRGCGYVFDDNFISVDDAKAEVESFLGIEVEPRKIIKFDSGHIEQFWKNNVLYLGLSSSFVEPLEATSIHNTIIQTLIFVNEFLHKEKEHTILHNNQEVYNKRISLLLSTTVDFISMHYQGGRMDSEFWRYISQEEVITDVAKEIVEITKYSIPGYISLNGIYGSFSIPLANWIFAGMGMIDNQKALRSLSETSTYEIAEISYKNFYNEVLDQYDVKDRIFY